MLNKYSKLGNILKSDAKLYKVHRYNLAISNGVKKISLISLLLWLNLHLITSAFAQIIPSNILIEQAKEYDGKEVEFYGEVVGEPMKRGDFVWINVFDNFNAVGIWVKANEADIIKFAGDYHNQGDAILVKGVFHRACPQHGGDLDIHAISIDKIREGYPIAHFVPQEKNKSARTLLILLLAVTIIVLTGEKRKKRYDQTNF